MKYEKCNQKCQPEKGIHWLSDRFIDEDNLPKCCGCGATGVPHYGFGSSCPASVSGGHYFTPKLAQINANAT